MIALLYVHHVRQLQAIYRDRDVKALENSLIDDLSNLPLLDSAELLQLDLRLILHTQYLITQRDMEREGRVPPELIDAETEQHMKHLEKVYDRLLWLGLELRGFISSKIVVQ